MLVCNICQPLSLKICLTFIVLATEIVMAARPPAVTVEPHGCICPSQNYTCRASSVLRMDWWSDNFSDIISSLNGDAFTGNGVEVRFSAVRIGFTLRHIASHFQITDIQAINGIELTCYATNYDGCGSNSVTVCVSGKILAYIILRNTFFACLFRTCFITYTPVSRVSLHISCAQFPASSIWSRMCGLLCRYCHQRRKSHVPFC